MPCHRLTEHVSRETVSPQVTPSRIVTPPRAWPATIAWVTRGSVDFSLPKPVGGCPTAAFHVKHANLAYRPSLSRDAQ